MGTTISIEKALCIKCAKCVKVCPSKIFVQDEATKDVGTAFEDSCIVCGHCVAVCPEKAVIHSAFPADKVHPVDYTQLPTPEQMMLLIKNRRSNRAFSTKPVPQEKFDLILEAAHRAPTASNAQQVKFMLITDPEKLRKIIGFTIDVFGGMLNKAQLPFVKPLVKFMMPEVLRYIPIFKRIQADYEQGGDQILRKATAVIFIYTPKSSRLSAADANLAYQNGSLMAESLGVSQFYTGFVLNAAKMKKGKLEKMLGIDGVINAGMGLGVPLFRPVNYIDRKDIEVVKV